ncbi:MAG: hypothetical protein K2J20_02990 [Bacilli bacterium]|nr:hypothetical protein [Bacilli bacterium]
MKKTEMSLKNLTLQKRVKKLIKKSKENNLIKPHKDAYDDFSVKEEEHKGNKASFGR